MHKEAGKDETILRVSMDAKATVLIGLFSRRGKTRVLVRAADHDFKPDEKYFDTLLEGFQSFAYNQKGVSDTFKMYFGNTYFENFDEHKKYDNEIEKIKNESVTETELSKFKRTAKKSIINQMKSNSQMAALLTYFDVVQGNWELTFNQLEQIDKLTAEDVKRVANKYLTNKNRTIGEVVPEEDAD